MRNAILLIDQAVRANLLRMVEAATVRPVDMRAAATPGFDLTGHRRQMEAQTVVIPGPFPYSVTFSIDENPLPQELTDQLSPELQADLVQFRHMSMSIKRTGRVPNEFAVWMVAEELGFVGELFRDCHFWTEEIGAGDKAVNIMQSIKRPLTWCGEVLGRLPPRIVGDG